VAGNGRASITIGGYSLVAYLVNLNQVFLSVSDANVLFGFGEPQMAGSFNNSTLKGTYAGCATNPATFSVAAFSGEFSADGAVSVGNINGTEDIGAPSGPVSAAAFKGTYSVASSPTNGRGTMTISSGAGGNAIIYMISASKFVVLPLNDPNPAIWNFELASGSAPAPTSLASLSLNPTSVTGGNSSTGTVTLSGPAPSGGAQVTLSSSNTTAARVPSSVTVAAGATSATFAVSTSAVASSTSVVISGTYGATKTGSLTVTPTPAPSSTLSSLTLNPSGVVGGAQFSTGTVTLSGPAPAGGAQVMLSSSNGAASVPASVTVPAGASSLTFRVNTSAVLFPTSATISASYNGTTRTADLAVY
jgi:hypothetical protein